ncbi:MAG: deoxyribonuclease V [Myxococcota bacterium]
MKIPRAPHAWNLSPKQAVAVQRRMAERVSRRRRRATVRVVAGVDCAFSRDGALCLSAAVCWDVAEKRVVEEQVVVRPLTFPYVPGLLSFREAPAELAALRALRTTPDALMVDGHGLAHPRRFGIACHVGVVADLPTVGVAKSRLVGVHREPGLARGARTALRDGPERIGTVLRTRQGVAPVFVSIGHAVDLPTAERWVLACGGGFRLPEPTRQADRAVARAKKELAR